MILFETRLTHSMKWISLRLPTSTWSAIWFYNALIVFNVLLVFMKCDTMERSKESTEIKSGLCLLGDM